MKKIKNYSGKLLAFEVARLRTLYKNNPESRDRIVKRYKLIVDEYSSRGLRWFWIDHVLDKLIKESSIPKKKEEGKKKVVFGPKK